MLITGALGLVCTAQSERIVAEQSSGRAVTASTSTGLSQSIPVLVNAIGQEKTFKEDAFQAQVCLAWLYHTVGEGANALSTLPSGLEQASERLSRDGGVTARWTHVCIIKGAYIKGCLLENEESAKEVFRFYELMLPYISTLPSTFANTPENQSWTENFLSRYCILSYRHVMAHPMKSRSLLSPAATIPPASVLNPFRAYAKGWDARSPTRSGGFAPSSQVWRAYYDIISDFLQNNIVQPVFRSKAQQCTELKIVEKTLEAIQLKETSFPRADQVNTQIGNWADQVMANWRVLCGPSWCEEDLGGTDKAVLGRGVLNILYRVATRTFHSTRILRHLFTVHASLAEFYLASKAVDSYFEILLKGKARTEKSGEDEIGLDDDSTALTTTAAAVKMLCQYGRREDIEESLNVAKTIEGWLQKFHPDSSQKPTVSADDVPNDLVDQPIQPKPPVSSRALALGYHTLGVYQSTWARVTDETSSRSDLQNRALANFRSALAPDLGEEDNVEFLYSLAFVLAETRESDSAIAAIKQALSSATKDRDDDGVAAQDFAPNNFDDESVVDPDDRGLLLKCWHLLALLLTVRHDFTTAIASCEAASELYGSKSVLSGEIGSLTTSNLLLSEKKSLIELKITQLAILEVTDGPEEAVNASGELLGLYTKLFDYVSKPAPRIEEPSQSPPQSVNGTLRNLRGSILGLPKDSRLKSRKTEANGQDTASNSVNSYKTYDDETQPPTISVNGYDGPASPKKLQKKYSRRSMGSRRIARTSSTSRPSTSADSHHHHLNLHLPTRGRHDGSSTTDGSIAGSYDDSNQYPSDEVGVAITHDLPSIPTTPAATSDQPNPLHVIPSTAQNMNHRNPSTHPVSSQPPPQPTQPPLLPTPIAPLPEPIYAPEAQTRHALTLLAKIWLVIASLYRRASLPTDASGALAEATTHVQAIQSQIITLEGGSAADFARPAYGGVKSCAELWADVLAEQAALHVHLGELEKANEAFEVALGHDPDHPAATIGLCNLLLDEYAAPIPPNPHSPHQNHPTTPSPAPQPTLAPLPSPSAPTTNTLISALPTESLLPRLAARDRAYGLLSALTKSGRGCGSGEAWMALARAYELSGVEEREEECLWWVVELEEGRGVRGWGCLR